MIITKLNTIFFLSTTIIFLSTLTILLSCLLLTIVLTRLEFRDKATLTILIIGSVLAIAIGLALMYMLLNVLVR